MCVLLLNHRPKLSSFQRKLALATVGAIILSRGPAFAADFWPPDQADIAKLEAQLKFPDAREYARYYKGIFSAHGELLINGEMIKPKRRDDRAPGIYIVSQLPVVREGSCDVVHLRYAVKIAKLILVACGGPPL